MKNKIKNKIAFLLITIICSVTVHAADQNNLTISVPDFDSTIQGGGSGCIISNNQAGPASGFLNWNEGANHAILFDPTASGDPGDPGCGTGSFDGAEFQISEVSFLLADGTAFGSPNGETGIGTTSYTVSVHPLAVPGDPTAGPAAAIGSADATLVMDASGTYDVIIPLDINVDAPFFLAWTPTDFSPDNEVTSTLWDSVARPVGRQFINNNDGGGFVDQTDFLINGGSGWVLAAVSGDFAEILPESQPVPVNNFWAMGLLLIMLAGLGLVIIRRMA